jgi:hypothetical protein
LSQINSNGLLFNRSPTSHSSAGGGASSINPGSPDSVETKIALVMPEDTLVLSAPNAEAKNAWFQALQKGIVDALATQQAAAAAAESGGGGRKKRLNPYTTPPITRKTSYSFRGKIPGTICTKFL